MTYITLSTAASLTGFSKRTLWRRIAEGHLHPQDNTGQGDQARVPVDEIIDIARLKLEPEDRALILDADSGQAEAQCDLALLFLAQNHPTEAIQWLTAAADQRYPEALHQLGRCYIAGNGIKENEGLGIELIARAATLGHYTAKHMLTYLMDPAREPQPPAALEARLDTIEKNVVFGVLRETADPA